MYTPHPTRRAFVRRMSYVAPSILTFAAAPEYAKAGSAKPDLWGGWQKPERGIDWDIEPGPGKHGPRDGKDQSQGRAAKGKHDQGASGRAPEPGLPATAKGKPAQRTESARATGAGPRASGPTSPET